ncbi:phosphatidylethanolamine-binding protein [Melampsora americana]|nr:phosphatidylethanolamine-binding protein [Melampsora americana]
MPQIIPFQDTLHALIAANLTAGTTPLIPSGFRPTVDLVLSYDGAQVSMGNLFPTTVCTNPPNITFLSEDPAKSSLSYTLMLIDPDAPTPQSPTYADWCHWILPGLRPTSYNQIITALSNISDSSSTNETASDAEKVIQTRMPIVPYYPPGPDSSSDPHRYIFLLYREPSPSLGSYVSLKSETIGIVDASALTRKSFNTGLFVETYQLTLVGFNWFKGVDVQRFNDFD